MTFNFLIVLAGIVFVIISIEQKLPKVPDAECLGLCIRLRLLLGRIGMSFVSRIVLFLLLFAHLGLVFAIWVLIRIMGELSVFVRFVFGVITLVGIVLVLFLLPSVATITSVLEKVIQMKKMLYYCPNMRIRWRFYMYARWRAQQCLIVPCGSLFRVDRSTTMDFLNGEMNNVANAVILVVPV